MNRTAIAQALRRTGAALLRIDAALPRMTRRSWTFDVVIAAAALAYALRRFGSYTANPGIHLAPGRLPSPVPAIPPVFLTAPPVSYTLLLIATALSTLPLALRRRLPLSIFVIVTCAMLMYHVNGGLAPTFAVEPALIAAYSALMYSPYRLAAITSVAATAAIAARFGELPHITSALIPIIAIVPAGMAFNMLNTWQQRAETTREKLQALEAEQVAATQLAVEQERARLASELHDVVTHNVSVMVIQAGAARMVLESAPGQAREALLAVETSGRAALAELRHAMGLLTTNRDTADGDDAADEGVAQPTAADLAPQPGLAQTSALAERVRDTGVPVELTVTGTPVPLPPGADLAGYRVVQEALTNTVKHAHGAWVQITIAYTPAQVTVDVADTGGVPAAVARSGSGRGLNGLRDRLAVYGGTLHAGKRPTGGFTVRAVIPTGTPPVNGTPTQSAARDREPMECGPVTTEPSATTAEGGRP